MLEITVLEARHLLHVIRELSTCDEEIPCDEVDDAIEILESLLDRADL